MKKYFINIILFFTVALTSYWGTLLATPYVILLVVKTGAKSSLNVPVYADVITDKDRHVVMPNPDFLYVACGFDIRKAPLRITGTMPEDSYCSLALYTANTRNFFIQNDLQSPDKKVDLILVKKGEREISLKANEKVIESPTTIGVMLVRILIKDTSRISYYKDIQHSFLVRPL